MASFLGMTTQNKADVLDLAIEFDGSMKHEYVATISGASSMTDRKSRVLMFFQKSSTNAQIKALYVQVDAKYQYVDEPVDQMKSQWNDRTKQPFSDIKFKLSYSLDSVLEMASARGKIEMKQSPEFKEYMREQSQWQSSANTNAQRRNTADVLDVELHYSEATVEYLKKEFGVKPSNLYNYLRYATHMYLSEDSDYQGEKDKISFEVRFAPDMSFANATLKTSNMKSEWKGFRMPHMIRNVVVVPRNWNIFEEVARNAIQNRDTCLITENEINTFENQAIKHTTFGNTWHLAVHKMRESGKYESNDEIKKQSHYVSVLVRDGQENQHADKDEVDRQSQMYGNEKKIKEVLMVLHQKTKKDITLRLSPSRHGSGKVPQLFVNDQEQKLSPTMNIPVYSNEYPKEILARAFVVEQNTMNGQRYGVMVETKLGHLEVTYDGEWVKIRSKSLLRNNRGICGSFTGQKTNELKSPQNTILQNDADFVASWAVIADDTPSSLKQMQYRIKEKQYPEEKVLYGDAISSSHSSKKPFYEQYENDHDNSNKNQHRHRGSKAKVNAISNRNTEQHGTRHQTQYHEDKTNGRICFSKRPLPVCAPGTKANGKLIQKVEAYCRDINDPAAQQYKSQIMRGRNLDMNQYASNSMIKFAVPKRCEQI